MRPTAPGIGYGRLTNITSSAGAFGYQYAGFDLPQTLNLPTGAASQRTYDGVGRLKEIALIDPAGNTLDLHAYSCDRGSQRTQQVFRVINYADNADYGHYVNYTYDSIGQLKTARGFEQDGQTPRLHEQLGYAYDGAWNLNWRTNNALVQSFGVNNLNELTNAGRSGTLTLAGTATERRANYSGDYGVTNVTVSGTGLGSGAAELYADGSWARPGASPANGQNSYSATAQDYHGRQDTDTISPYLPSAASFTYDANGNLTGDGRRTFEYDAESQLTNVYVTGQWRSEFGYDGLMRRRVRKEFTWAGGTWVKTNEVRYVCDGSLVIQERGADNLALVTYTRGTDVSGGLQGAGGIGGLLARTDNVLLNTAMPQVAHAYYHCDGNGNVTCLANSSNAVVARYTYEPFGNSVALSGPLAEANVYRFSSKEYHPNSGLLYYLYRFYDPHFQRWLKRDPIFERGGVNLYRFVRNRPTSKIDPHGLADCNPYGLWGMGGPGMGNFASRQGAIGLSEALSAARQAGYPAAAVVSAAADEDFAQSTHISPEAFVFGGGEFPLGHKLHGEGLGLFGINESGMFYGGLGAFGPGLMFGYEQTNQDGEWIWLLDPGLGWGLYHSGHATGVFVYWPPKSPVFVGCGVGIGR